MASIKNIKNLIRKTSLHIEQLESTNEERDRLIRVLKLTPSSNDNYDLTGSLSKSLKNFKYIEHDISDICQKGDIKAEEYEELIEAFKELVHRYNVVFESLKDDEFLDTEEFEYKLPDLPELSIPTKTVRFMDDVEVSNDHDGDVYQPYRDDESVATLESVPDRQIFAQHQQQILTQDENLGFLHDSVKRQHQMGVDINHEIDDHLILLNDLEEGVERSHHLLNNATRRIKSFRQKCRENGSLVTIIVLTIILILLLVMLN